MLSRLTPSGGAAVLTWIACVLGTTVAGLVILHASFTAFADRCYELHESPNNVGGGLIVVGSISCSALVARQLRPTVKVRWLAAGLVAQALVFALYMVPSGDC